MRTLARAEDRAAILRRLREVHPGSPRRWGTLSPHQMVCHLADSLRMAVGQRPVSRADTRAGRVWIKWAALYLPIPWPQGLPTRPEIDPNRTGTQPLSFDEDMTELVALLEGIAASGSGFAWPSHPVFGPMSPAAWLRWGFLHLDHHLRQFGA